MGSVAQRGRQAKAAPNNLPRHLTSFVNREADVRTLKALLSTMRLITLVGPGGVGKSRLAAEISRANLDRWPDGAWWIELAFADDVAQAVVGTLELPGRGSPLDVAASWLAPRRAILILDNCEQLAADSANFCQAMLARCPELNILATSREPLGVPGEVRLPVSSLGDPDAIRLFESRARLVAPSYALASPNRKPVSKICDRLDHLPLAIEMAAARVDLMSERELLANLNDRFALLASGSRNAPDHQQAMLGAIDWSHRLLTASEARLFRRLAVFQGGFALEAVRSIHSDAGGAKVLGVLTGLVQKSMVVADRLQDGGTRYRLLESHHAFALEKLAESGELDDMRRRHYEHYRSQKWTARESPNFWAAVAWARDRTHDFGLGLAIELAESEFFDQTRVRNLLVDRLARAQARNADRARALNLAARLATRHNDRASARTLADASVSLARELGDPKLIAYVLRGAGGVYHASGHMDVATRMYEEALALFEQSADRRAAVEVQNRIGLIAYERGDSATALEILRECVAFGRASLNLSDLGRHLESLANAQLGVGDVEGAAASWKESLSIFGDQKDQFGMIWTIGGLALLAGARNDDKRALRLAAVVDRLSRESSLSAFPFRVNQLKEATTRIRRKLGPRKCEILWTEAQSMDLAAQLEYALSEADVAAAATRKGRPVATRSKTRSRRTKG
jgi:non-specific serine/threonine protein kinase